MDFPSRPCLSRYVYIKIFENIATGTFFSSLLNTWQVLDLDIVSHLIIYLIHYPNNPKELVKLNPFINDKMETQKS